MSEKLLKSALEGRKIEKIGFTQEDKLVIRFEDGRFVVLSQNVFREWSVKQG
jgi:hypothetical protein